jgi:hypothetical protein
VIKREHPIFTPVYVHLFVFVWFWIFLSSFLPHV